MSYPTRLFKNDPPEIDHARRYCLKYADFKLEFDEWIKLYKLLAAYRIAPEDDIWFGPDTPFEGPKGR